MDVEKKSTHVEKLRTESNYNEVQNSGCFSIHLELKNENKNLYFYFIPFYF